MQCSIRGRGGERRSSRLDDKKKAKAATYPVTSVGKKLHRGDSFGVGSAFSKSIAISTTRNEINKQKKKKKFHGTVPPELEQFVKDQVTLRPGEQLHCKLDGQGRPSLSCVVVSPSGDMSEKVKPKPALPPLVTSYDTNRYDLGHGATHSLARTDIKEETDKPHNISLELWQINQGYTRGIEYAAQDLAKEAEKSGVEVRYVKQPIYADDTSTVPEKFHYYVFEGDKPVATAAVQNNIYIGDRPT